MVCRVPFASNKTEWFSFANSTAGWLETGDRRSGNTGNLRNTILELSGMHYIPLPTTKQSGSVLQTAQLVEGSLHSVSQS